MHILCDSGLITVTSELRIEVSPRIREQYTNGKLHCSYHGSELRNVPAALLERPSADFLDWHNRNQFDA